MEAGLPYGWQMRHCSGQIWVSLARNISAQLRTELNHMLAGEVGDRKVGEPVNLERAMGAHVRFGGHFVQVYLDSLHYIHALNRPLGACGHNSDDNFPSTRW